MPVIGAGFSLNVSLPEGQTMPTWEELTSLLRNRIKIQETDPLLVTQEFERKSDRTTLISTITEFLYKNKVKPSFAHRELISITDFDVICTTNYDSLLEDACKREERPASLIVNKQDISSHGSDQELRILKMHGDLEHKDELIITKKDYETYEEKKESFVVYLKSLLMTRTPLFIGFSMQDPNFKQIKEMIDSVMGESARRGYIIQFDPTLDIIQKYAENNLNVIPIQTNERPKSEALVDFLNQINPSQDNPIQNETHLLRSIKLSVSSNKRILFKNQQLKIRVLTNASPSQIFITITNQKNVKLLEKDMKDAIRISDDMFETAVTLSEEKWKESQNYTIYAKVQDQTATDIFRLSQPENIIVTTNEENYPYGAEIIMTGIIPHASLESIIDYHIVDSEGNNICQSKIRVTCEDTGIFQEKVRIEKDAAIVKDNEDFAIFLKYNNQQARTIVTVKFKPKIELDQKTYSWTDKIRITATIPDYNEKITTSNYMRKKRECIVSIKTSKGRIRQYRLEEKEDTRVFTGEITLTGIPGANLNYNGMKKYAFGTTSNNAPNNGRLACLPRDRLTVIFKDVDNRMAIANALISWNIGEVQFLKPRYTCDELVKIRIIDPDMNLDPNEIDSFNIKLASTSDSNGIEIPVYETSPESGIFEGIIVLDKQRSTPDGCLKAVDGDDIHATYIDTIPNPYSSKESMIIMTTAKIYTK